MTRLTSNIFDELKDLIKGDVYTDKLRRYMLSTDGSIFKVEPACVVYPRDTEDVVNTVNFAANYGLSIHSRGSGSGLCGSAIGKGIVLDFSKYMNALIGIDYDNRTFECEPGYRLGELEAELKGDGLFFPPDPSSGEYASFGGMYGTNASGAHSVKYGNVADYIVDAKVVLSSGEVVTFSEISNTPYDYLPDNFKKLYQLYMDNEENISKAYPHVRYNVAGYNLRDLVIDGKLNLKKLFGGSEGTLGIVTKLKFRLIRKPKYDSLVVAFFDDIVSAAKAVQQILLMNPAGIEIMDKSLLKIARDNDEKLRDKIPNGIDNVILIEFDSSDSNECRQLAEEARQLMFEKGLTDNAYLAVSAEEKEKFWAVRKAAVPILYKLKGKKKILAIIEDAVVSTDKLVKYFDGLYSILNNHNTKFVIYGHIAKGLLHTRPLLDLKDANDINLLKVLADEVFQLVHSLGGVVSGEHGDGRLRSTYIAKQYPEIYQLFLQTKFLFDESNILNPEIKTVFDEHQMQKLLRYGNEYRSNDFQEKLLVWKEAFVDEVEKCHGCSKCTTVTTKTRMCPIYKFSRDEAATPKAKANILRALISGAIEDKSLYEKLFQSVIDQCVNCGSCYKECPSNVNIPKLALEARGKYAKKYGISLKKKLIVNAELAGKTTRKFSGALKAIMNLKPSRKISELFTGISAEREFLAFPPKSLFERIEFQEGAGDIKVMYYAGCYASYIKPEIGQAVIKVLKSMNVLVYTPKQHCCGLPMLSKGMVKQAKKKIKDNFRKWAELLKNVDYIVVSCSSCGLSLMQEWGYLLNSDEVEVVCRKTIHISDFVNKHSDKLKADKLRANKLKIGDCNLKVSYHLPCHLKVQTNPDSSVKMLSLVSGIEVEDIQSHCCGIAGSWGIASEYYDLSVKIGSDMRKKLNSSDSTVGVTDCPTCRMQMEHLSDKKIKHPIEVLAECIEENDLRIDSEICTPLMRG